MSNLKLYLVTCKGLSLNLGTKISHGVAYVVSENPDLAYKKLRSYLDKKDLGFSNERELDNIKLLAELTDYPDCGYRLFIDYDNIKI